MKNVYAIRRAILETLASYTGSPITAVELVDISPKPAIIHHEKEDCLKEFGLLKQFGYIEAVPGFGGQQCRLAKKGLQQLQPEFPQDSFVWGPDAK